MPCFIFFAKVRLYEQQSNSKLSIFEASYSIENDRKDVNRLSNIYLADMVGSESALIFLYGFTRQYTWMSFIIVHLTFACGAVFCTYTRQNVPSTKYIFT